MNHSDVVLKVAEKSGVAVNDCHQVIKALEEVLSDELSQSGGVGKAFDKIYSLMSFLKKK